MPKILLIDDEEFNLDILSEYLSPMGYILLTATNGRDGFDLLTRNADIDIIILDRMMPVMDGMEFMALLSKDPKLSLTPVILQSAAAAPAQVAQGIAAGVFYYLAKPYHEQVLRAVVQAALRMVVMRKRIHQHATNPTAAIHLADEVEFSFQTPHDVEALLPLLASLPNVSQKATYGLNELMSNAIEHGNLGITYAEKKLWIENGNYHSQLQLRLTDPEKQQRRAYIRYQRTQASASFTIEDQGTGFAWDEYLTIAPERLLDPNGRGIALARLQSFSKLEYQGKGNIVIATL